VPPVTTTTFPLKKSIDCIYLQTYFKIEEKELINRPKKFWCN
jgi:hypothetical protein